MTAAHPLLLPSVYLGPTSWYAKLLQHPGTEIELHEHYIKQTWRNRCRIVGANGTQDLVIPVHLKGNHTSMQDVLIDYDGNWQRRHWQSIRSAYGNSPFFDFYADYFAPFFEKKNKERLVDFNTELLLITLRILKQSSSIKFTQAFQAYEKNDLRLTLSPKLPTLNSELPTPNSKLPTPNSQLPTPNSQLPTPNSQLPTLNSELPTPNSQLPIPNSQLPTPNSQLPTPNSQLPTPNSQLPTYLQVFQERHGFIPNLSIIDLLCCCGPASINVLKGQ